MGNVSFFTLHYNNLLNGHLKYILEYVLRKVDFSKYFDEPSSTFFKVSTSIFTRVLSLCGPASSVF